MAVEDDTESDTDTGTDYPEGLDLLSDGTRVAILRELARAESPLRFAELRRRVGVRDSGVFNYHLSKLCSRFVRETEEGYELDRAGTRLVAATDVAVRDDASPADLAECPVCGESDCERLYHVHLETW